MKTTDLIDKYEDALSVVNIAAYQHYGTKREFHGKVITVRCFEDNTKAKALLETQGDGRVLVIDGRASYGRALMGDNVAAIAIKNGWEGVIVNGYIRDVADINHMPIGVVALGSTPRRPKKIMTGNVISRFHLPMRNLFQAAMFMSMTMACFCQRRRFFYS